VFFSSILSARHCRRARDHNAVKRTGISNEGCCLPSRGQTHVNDGASDPYTHSNKASLLPQQVQVAALPKRASIKVKDEKAIPYTQGCCAPLLAAKMHSNCQIHAGPDAPATSAC